MRVLKIELAGTTTSFRYPHFLVGRQPSLPLPPPSTIYGHISSALGEFPDPSSLRFGYSFRCAGSVDDLESQHIVKAASGKFGAGYPKNIEGNVNPTLRQVLLQPRLSLYLKVDDSEFERYRAAFRQPHYPVALGRSQDLATYTLVKEIRLEERSEGYIEGSLLPTEYREQTGAGILTQMPRYIDPENRRDVQWKMYLTIEGLVQTSPNSADRRKAKKFYTRDKDEQPLTFWVDPESTVVEGRQRIVFFHDFTLTAEDFDYAAD